MLDRGGRADRELLSNAGQLRRADCFYSSAPVHHKSRSQSRDEHLTALKTAVIWVFLFFLLCKSPLNLKMGYGSSYQAYVPKNVKKDNVATVVVHEQKAVFYKSYMEKWLFRLL